MNYDFNYKDIIKSLKSVGLKKGDTIYLTGNLSLLGRFEKKAKNIPSFFYKALKNVLGEKGTITFPTHSYYLLKNKKNSIFDKKNSPCETGVLPEFLRKLKKSYRQDHPYASVSSIGKYSKYVVSGYSKNAWGDDSPMEKLINLNTKVVNFGLHPRLCCTNVHHAEQKFGVSYRYHKSFKQKIKIGKKIIKKETKIFVLKEEFINIKRNKNKKIFRHFCKNNKIQKKNLGRGFLYCYSMKDFYEDNLRYFSKDPYAWVGYDPNLKRKEK